MVQVLRRGGRARRGARALGRCSSTCVRFAGAAYLVYLGVQAVRHRRELSTVLDVTATRPSRHICREGFVVGVTNPKVIVFFTAVLPQFVDPNGAVRSRSSCSCSARSSRSSPSSPTAAAAWPPARPGPGWRAVRTASSGLGGAGGPR